MIIATTAAKSRDNSKRKQSHHHTAHTTRCFFIYFICFCSPCGCFALRSFAGGCQTCCLVCVSQTKKYLVSSLWQKNKWVFFLFGLCNAWFFCYFGLLLLMTSNAFAEQNICSKSGNILVIGRHFTPEPSSCSFPSVFHSHHSPRDPALLDSIFRTVIGGIVNYIRDRNSCTVTPFCTCKWVTAFLRKTRDPRYVKCKSCSFSSSTFLMVAASGGRKTVLVEVSTINHPSIPRQTW